MKNLKKKALVSYNKSEESYTQVENITAAQIESRILQFALQGIMLRTTMEKGLIVPSTSSAVLSLEQPQPIRVPSHHQSKDGQVYLHET